MLWIISTCVLLLLLVAGIGFFASSETAFLSLPKIKLRQLVRNRKKHAKTAAYLRNDMDGLLTLVLVGTNFLNTFASALATILAMHIAGDNGIGIATAVITFFVTTFGQIIPKTYAVLYPAETACRFAPVLAILKKIFFPLVWIFSQISLLASYITGKFWKVDTDGVTEDELKILFAVGEKEGTLEKNETIMLNKVFKFSDLLIHDIMKHRSMIRAVPVSADENTVIASFISSGFSRLPVYELETETIIGLINYKTVLFNSGKYDDGKGFARRCMLPVLFVPETFTPLELLARFKQEHTDFAVVLDEQGCTAGIATMNDVMRVIFERMTDENPASDVSPESRIQFANSDEFLLPGDMAISDVNEIFRFNLESEEFNTIGGWLLEQFGYLPSVGEVYTYRDILFIVEDQAQRRILTVRLKRIQKRQKEIEKIL
jgi:putative hemolysin